MNKGTAVVLGLLAAYYSTQLFDYTQEKITARRERETSKKMTEEQMKVEIDLVLAMHNQNLYRTKSALDSKYSEICKNTFIDSKVRVYGLNLITEELKKVDEQIKAEKETKTADVSKSVKDFEEAMNNLVNSVKQAAEKMKTAKA